MPKRPPSFRYQSRAKDRREWDQSYRITSRTRKAQQIRNSAEWQACRERVRARWPVCCDPFGDHEGGGHVAETKHVHHIEPLDKRPDLAFDDLNHAPLCVACHAKIEGMERRGEQTGHLFRAWMEQVEAELYGGDAGK